MILSINWTRHVEYQTLPMIRKPGSKQYEVSIPADAINESYDFMYFFF